MTLHESMLVIIPFGILFSGVGFAIWRSLRDYKKKESKKDDDK